MPEQSNRSSDNAQAAAGDTPRCSSAQAAALTVGSPSSHNSQAVADGAAKLSTKTKGGIIALAAVSLLLICVGAFALSGNFGPQGAQSSQAQQAQQTATQEAHVSSQTAESAQSSQEQAANASNEDEHPNGSTAAEQQASGETSSSNDGGGASVNSSNTASNSGNAQSSPSQGNGSGSHPAASAGQQPAQSNVVTVSVSVDSSAVGNPVSSIGTFSFNPGATPYDALCALGLSVNAHGSTYGTYVSAIGGLAEREHGGMSGWMYSVNGTTPMTACSNYVLSDGDNVVWYYVAG